MDSIDLSTIDLSTFWAYYSSFVAIASLVLIALALLEGAIEIWHARHEGCRFWAVWVKLTATVEYISHSRDRVVGLVKRKPARVLKFERPDKDRRP